MPLRNGGRWVKWIVYLVPLTVLSMFRFSIQSESLRQNHVDHNRHTNDPDHRADVLLLHVLQQHGQLAERLLALVMLAVSLLPSKQIEYYPVIVPSTFSLPTVRVCLVRTHRINMFPHICRWRQSTTASRRLSISHKIESPAKTVLDIQTRPSLWLPRQEVQLLFRWHRRTTLETPIVFNVWLIDVSERPSLRKRTLSTVKVLHRQRQCAIATAIPPETVGPPAMATAVSAFDKYRRQCAFKHVVSGMHDVSRVLQLSIPIS